LLNAMSDWARRCSASGQDELDVAHVVNSRLLVYVTALM
jgi:hypothetical protein